MRFPGKQALVEWSFVGFLVLLCAILTALQYRWTGEISRAEATRLRASLSEGVEQLCRAFDVELTTSCSQLTPRGQELDEFGAETAHLERFRKWQSGKPRPMFSRVAVAARGRDGVQLFQIEQKEARFEALEWPESWSALRNNLSRKTGRGGGSPPFDDPKGSLIHFPIFGFEGDSEWVIFELNLEYLTNSWLPELVETYLNPDGRLLDDVRVKTLISPSTIIYSWRNDTLNSAGKPFSAQFNRQGRDPQDRRGANATFRWVLEAWHRPGALEAIVSASRTRNLAVAVLLTGLILVSGLALLRYTRRSRQLADAQMNFVANVSHELRTPLTVIRGAGHNLLRGVVQDPGQVEEYSRLIIQHADQLTAMVEQVLALAGAKKNQAAALRQPVALAEVLNEAVTASIHDTEAAHCEVHLDLPPSLPAITGDAAALRRAFQNLINNAAKHGGEGGWIGITAVSDEDSKAPMVEVQVADRGPGIPANELFDIFKPFFRGANAQAMQIRGSGLGLSLVREIIEAHNGSISVANQNGRGAIFTVRLPATPFEGTR